MLRPRKDSPRSKARKSSPSRQRFEQEVVLRLPIEPYGYREPVPKGVDGEKQEVISGRGSVDVDFYI